MNFLGGVFCGESMFHRQTNASKLAFIALCRHFSAHQGQLIDCQMMTAHLQSLGVVSSSRKDFIAQLNQHKEVIVDTHCWQQQNIVLY